MNVRFRCDPALIDVLPKPRLARASLPDWLRTMPASAFSALHDGELRTVKHCPPFIDAMSHGFVMPLPCDIRVDQGVVSWDWDLPALSVGGHTRSPISFHVPEQVTGTPFHSGALIIKFNSFWTIELDEGWSLFATHPVNRSDLPFQLLTGVVDCDLFNAVGIFFPAVWRDPGFSGTLPRGTPVAQCFPVPRDALSLDCRAFDELEARRYSETGAALKAEPGVYRKTFRGRRD